MQRMGNIDRLNLLKMPIESYNALGVPEILPVQLSQLPIVSVLPWRSVKFERITKQQAAHGFVDDYRLETTWNSPERGLKYAQQFAFVCSPDFTLSPEYPLALNFYQLYRSRWVARYWQNNGVLVVPSVGWAAVDSFDYAFVGIPQNSVVAIATYGIRNNVELFAAGYRAMCAAIEPAAVYVCGKLPKELQTLAAVRTIEPYHETIKRARLSAVARAMPNTSQLLL